MLHAEVSVLNTDQETFIVTDKSEIVVHINSSSIQCLTECPWNILKWNGSSLQPMDFQVFVYMYKL